MLFWLILNFTFFFYIFIVLFLIFCKQIFCQIVQIEKKHFLSKQSSSASLYLLFLPFFYRRLNVTLSNEIHVENLLNNTLKSHHRAYPVYVNEYASGTQQQYYTTNESYSATGNHQSETYIVPVEEALLTNQSRESPQALSAVSKTICFFLFG